MSNFFKTGTMVKFDIVNKFYTDEGFLVGGTVSKNNSEMFIYENIELENFPSFKDFTGKKTKVNHDDVAIILKRVGRPFKISNSKKWEAYDIYEVMIDNQKRCVFKFNLKEL